MKKGGGNMTQYRTFEEDWDYQEEDITRICVICGEKIDKEKLRKALRKKHAKPENVWLPFTILLRSIIDNER